LVFVAAKSCLERHALKDCSRTALQNLYYEFLSSSDDNLVSLSEDFMTLLPMHPYFRNSAKEFYPDETLSTPMKLLSSLSSSVQCHISLFNAHETLTKPH
jgi:hypothetical protein